MMSSDEEDSDCPLCMEELDIADRNFRPCPCGYQICRFCWHHIKTNLNGRCPACRRLYSDQIVEFVPVSAEEIMRLKKEKKEKDRQTREMKDPSRRQLSNVRVVQKNLVYVLGLSSKYASVENEFFKKYGRIDKVVISKRTAPTGSSSSVGIYVTYIRKEDASRAIEGMNGIEVEGKTIRASYGTTKYCTYYLRHMACPNPNCMYLHEPGDDIDSYNKDTIPIGKHATSTSTTTSGYPNKRPATATKVVPSTTPTSSSTTPEPKPTTTPRTWAPIPKVVPISPVVVADKEEPSSNTETNSPSLSKENIKPSTSSKNTKPIASASSSTSANKPTPSAKLTKKPSGIIDKSHTPKKAPVVIEEDEKPALPASASWATAQPVVNVGNTMTPANFGPSLSDALNAPQKPKHSPSVKVKKEKKTKNKMVRLEEFEEAEREAKLAATKSKLGGPPSAAAIVAGVAKPQQHIETKQPLSEESVPEDKHSEQDIVMDEVSMKKEPEVSEVKPEENVDVSGIQNTNVDDENKVTEDTEPVDIVPDEEEDAKNDTFGEDSAIDTENSKSDSIESIENEDIKVPEVIDNAPNMSNDNKLELHEAVDNTLEDNDKSVQQESIANEEVNQDTLDTAVDDDKLAALNDTVVKAFDEAAAAAADATSEKVEASEQAEQLDEHVDEYETKEEQFVQNISSPLAAMDRLSALVQQEIMSDSPKQPPFDLSQQEELQRQQPIQQQQQQPLPPNMNRFDMGMPMQESFENRQPPVPPPGLGGPPPPPPGWMNRGFDPFNGQDPSIIAARRLQHSQRMLEASGLFGGHPPVVPRFGFSPDFNRGSNGFLPQQPPPMGMFPPPPHHPPHPPHPMMRHPPPPELMNMQPPFGPPLHMQPPQQHVQQVEMQNDMPRSQPQQQLMDNLRNDFNTMKINGNEHQQSRDDLRALLPNVNISFNNLEEKRRAEEFYQQQLLMQRQQQQQHMLQQQQQMHHQALQQQRMQEQEQIPNLRRPELAGFSSPPMQPPQESMLMKSPMNQQWQQPQQQEPQQQNGGEDKRANPDVREAQNFFGEFLRKAASNQQEGSPQKEEPPAQQNHSLPFQDPAIMSVRVENNNENNELLNSQNTILRILGGQAPPPPSGMMTLEQQQQMHQQRQMDARFMMDQHQRMMHQNDMGPNGMFMRPPPPPNFAQQQQQQQSPQQQQQFHQQGFMSGFREPPMGMMGRMPPPPPGMMRPPMPPLNDMRFRNMGNGQPFPPPPPPGMFSNEENRQ